MASAYSEKRRRDSAISARSPLNSTRPRPRPNPRSTRPPDMWSRTEISSATRTGSCQGSTTTMEPSSTRWVRAATQLRNWATLGHMW